MGGQCHAQSTLPQGKTQHPLYRRLGGLQSFSGRVRKISSTGTGSPDRPARSESLYRLSYRGPPESMMKEEKSLIEKIVWKECQGVLSGVEEDASLQKRDAVPTGI